METIRVHGIIAILLVAAAITLVAGCASQVLDPPELTLVDLQPTEATLFETTLLVKLRIANPNPDPLTFEGASFKLTLEGQKVGRGMTAETVTIDRFGTEVIAATFHVSNASLLLKLQQVMAARTVSYGVTGKLYVLQSGRSSKLKVQSSGQLDLGARTPGPIPDSPPTG